MSMSVSRVAITGLGVVTPLGDSPEALFKALSAGRSGVRPITTFPVDDQPTRIAATIPDFEPEKYVDRKLARHLDRTTQFAIAAAKMALADSGLDASVEPEAIATCVGTGAGCLGTIEEGLETLQSGGPRRVSPFLAAMMLPNMPAAQVSIQLGLKGPIRALSSACATGADNVAAGFDLIQRGMARAVVAGGSDAVVTPLSLAAFASARSLSRNNAEPLTASRPFDRRRDGFVMGEGAGMIVLESLESARARGARIYAEVLGYGSTSDAYHITAPPDDGEGLVRAIHQALAMAGLPPEAIDYVNAHGTSTPLNDKVETQALKQALGDHAYRVPISSTKSMIGHLLGAAGAVELVVVALSIQKGFVHPTANLEEPDPECDLDYVPKVGRRVDIRVAMSNSLGFGGHNASLVVGRV